MAPLPRAGPAAVATQPSTTTAPPAAAHVQGDATSWWLSTEKTPARAPERSAGARVTVCVDVDSRGIIVAAPPIARKFIRQPAKNLGFWLRRQPGFRCERL